MASSVKFPLGIVMTREIGQSTCPNSLSEVRVKLAIVEPTKVSSEEEVVADSGVQSEAIPERTQDNQATSRSSSMSNLSARTPFQLDLKTFSTLISRRRSSVFPRLSTMVPAKSGSCGRT